MINICLKFLGIFNAMPELKILGDSPTTEDGLGFDSYVDILFDAIINFDAKNPLTIGIHGRWGSGKTSLMRMLDKRFEKDNKVKTIWFNAWAHGREEPIGLALLQQVLIEFQKDKKTKGKIGPLIENVGTLLTDAALRKISGITLGEAKKLLKNSIEAKSTLRADFATAIDEYLPDKRLVVFIDDLDRCLPEKTIEILEVIKLFLDVPRCVFVIGVAKEVIEQGIEVVYKTEEQGIPISGKDYTEKIIQVPFTLPPIREKVMIEYIGKLGISEEEKEYADFVAKVTEYNPRKVKMFLNTLRIRQAISKRTGEEIQPELSAKFFAIEFAFPVFYKDVVKYREQDFLCQLERLAKEEAVEELRKELEGSETLQKYYKNEDLKNLLKEEPFFCGMDIRPYIYLSGKPPEEVLVFDELVFDEFLSGDGTKIRHAASMIKKMPDSVEEQYVNMTISKLSDDDKIVRWRAARSLGYIGDARVLEPLIKKLEEDTEEGVRGRAARSLGRIIERLKEDTEEGVRGVAARSSRIIGYAKTVESLIKALQDKKERGGVRESAAGALGMIGDPKAVGPLIVALEDEAVRSVFVAEALGEIGDDRAVEPLIEAFKDKNARVRLHAAYALGNIGGDKAVELLIETLRDEYANLRLDAALALGRIGDPKAVEPLIEALKDKDGDVRKYAADALGRIGDPKAVGPLKETFNDVYPPVTIAVKDALEKIKAKQKST
jgi:HEAT repeat protein